MNTYSVRSGDLWEAAVYITMGAKLVGIEPALTNGRVSCQLIIEGENLAALQKQYFAGLMEARIFEFRRVLGYLHSAVNKSKKKFQNMLKNGSTELTNRGATLDTASQPNYGNRGAAGRLGRLVSQPNHTDQGGAL